MHVIVGQGQLDSILHATPEDRRGFVEEAAGVLKHRKRKEKALRKLDACDGNLTRLTDLLGEIRRQLKPLGRQAEVARRAVGVQSAVRDAKARLIADDLVTARASLQQELADESVLVARREEVEGHRATATQRESDLEAALREDLPALARAQETWFALSGLRERLRGTQSLAAERVRNAEGLGTGDVATGRDPEALEAEAAQVREQESAIETEVEAHRVTLEQAVSARRTAEDAVAEEERRVAGQHRAAADRREGLARLIGQVNALRSRAAAADDELGRLTQAHEDALSRAARAQRDFTALETRVAGLDAGEEGLDAEHEGAAAQLDDLEEQLAKVREEAQRAERDRATLAARKDALELGLNRKDGAGALLAASDQVSGLLGSVAALLTVRSGFETAVATCPGQRSRRRRDRERRLRDRGDRPPQGARPGARRDGARLGSVVRCQQQRQRVAGAAGGRGICPRRGHLPRHRPPGARQAARPHRRGRRPGRGPGIDRPRRLADRGDPGRRPARSTRRRRWLGQPAEPHRDPGRGRRGRPAAVRGDRLERAARLRHVPAGAGAPRGPEAGRRRTRQAARVRRHPGRGGRGARPVRRPGARRPRRGRAARAGDRRGSGGPHEGPRGARRPRGAAGPRRGGPRSRGGHRRPRAARRGRPCCPAGRDGGPALAADRRGAVARPARPGRPAAARRPGRARDPRPRDRAPGPAAPRGRGGPGRRRGGRLRARPARRLDRQGRSGPRGGRARPPGSRGAAARRPRPAAGPGPGARRARQLRPPRRDGPHPAEDAHRATRGARARGARPRRRRAGRRVRPRPAGPRRPQAAGR